MNVYIAPRLGVLRDHLLARVQRSPLPPRDTEIIVVQSQGMRQWLTLAMADALGCAGSVELPFPARFVRALSQSLGLPAPAYDPFSREALTWRLDRLLRAIDLSDARYAALRKYLGDGDDRMRFGLAAQIASRFDDYQLFRHDLLEAWERGEHRLSSSSHELWQASLWRELCADEQAAGAAHGAQRLTTLIERVRSAARGTLPLPSRVTVFGVSSLAPRIIDLLAALSVHTEVVVYAAILAEDTPHPVAQAFGTQGSTLQRLLSARGARCTVLEVASGSQQDLLTRLQCELMAGDDGTGPIQTALSDRSLRVHAAHGKLRELEIIRDQIGQAFLADRDLRPHDVLLLVPDISEWAPLVQSVFGVNDANVNIPFAVADRRRRDESLASAFLRLLSLEGGRLTHSEVFGVLEQPVVYTAAGLNDGQVESLAHITREANVRWGYDSALLDQLSLPATDMPTWRTGLDRLLVGQLAGAIDEPILGLLPQAGDTLGDAPALAALSRWIDTVAATLQSWREPRAVSQWTATLSEFLNGVIAATTADERQALNEVREVIRTLARTAEQAMHGDTVPFSVVREWLEQQLADDSFGSGFLSGRMTVAALKPMRSVPFKVIAVAGLDDAAFPRRDGRPAFDLLQAEVRDGDRNLRDDDRQLFLDLLLAAESQLVLTYSGNDPRDNAVRAPSIVLDELLDHLDRRSDGAARQHLVVRHPLQPFSERYVSDVDERLVTFSPLAGVIGHYAAVEGFPFVHEPVPDVESDESADLTLRQLVHFWSNPSKWFCEHVLRLRLPDGGTFADTDCEPHWMSKLQQGGVRADLLRDALAGRRNEQRGQLMRRQLVAAGKLPPGELGGSWFTLIDEEARSVIEALPVGEREARSLLVIGPEWRITGAIDGVIDGSRFVARTGAFRAKHRIAAWVEHVVMCAARQQGAAVPGTTVLVYPDPKKDGAILESIPETTDAVALLASWISAMHTGRRAPLPFFPCAAEAYRASVAHNMKRATTPKSRLHQQDPLEKARTAYAGSDYGVEGDEADQYIRLCFRDVPAFEDNVTEFVQYTTLLFGQSVPEAYWPTSDVYGGAR